MVQLRCVIPLLSRSRVLLSHKSKKSLQGPILSEPATTTPVSHPTTVPHHPLHLGTLDIPFIEVRALGTLHLLFSVPRKFVLQTPTWLVPYFLQVLLQCHLWAKTCPGLPYLPTSCSFLCFVSLLITLPYIYILCYIMHFTSVSYLSVSLTRA